MNRRWGYGAYAALGALTGGLWVYGSQLGPIDIAVGTIVGALFGAALRDAAR